MFQYFFTSNSTGNSTGNTEFQYFFTGEPRGTLTRFSLIFRKIFCLVFDILFLSKMTKTISKIKQKNHAKKIVKNLFEK